MCFGSSAAPAPALPGAAFLGAPVRQRLSPVPHTGEAAWSLPSLRHHFPLRFHSERLDPQRGRRNELVLRGRLRVTVSVWPLEFADAHPHPKQQKAAPVRRKTPPPSPPARCRTVPDHGGEKWPAQLPRERRSQQTGAHEPVRDVGDRWILPELRPQVSRCSSNFHAAAPPASIRPRCSSQSPSWF